MPPQAKQMPLCKEVVKTEKLIIQPCATRLVNRDQRYVCPNISEHMLKFKTGFCSNGNCEGTAKKSPSGAAMPTCKWWKRCPCICHTVYDRMYAESEMPRVLVDNSGYDPPKHQFKMPTVEERIMLSNASRMNTPIVVESPVVDAVPPTLRRGFAPTPTGKAARGELESWVKDECDAWLIDKEIYPCTPPYLAEAIAKTQGLGKQPSVGAISSVFDRWIGIGFAVIGKKPTRFLSYTDEGVKLGLDGLKELRKRTRRFEDAATKRGTLR